MFTKASVANVAAVVGATARATLLAGEAYSAARSAISETLFHVKQQNRVQRVRIRILGSGHARRSER